MFCFGLVSHAWLHIDELLQGFQKPLWVFGNNSRFIGIGHFFYNDEDM